MWQGVHLVAAALPCAIARHPNAPQPSPITAGGSSFPHIQPRKAVASYAPPPVVSWLDSSPPGNEQDFVPRYVDALKQAGIQVGVITNHNKFDLDEFKALRKAARKEDIYVMPGIELSVRDGANGIHTLVVFGE